MQGSHASIILDAQYDTLVGIMGSVFDINDSIFGNSSPTENWEDLCAKVVIRRLNQLLTMGLKDENVSIANENQEEVIIPPLSILDRLNGSSLFIREV